MTRENYGKLFRRYVDKTFSSNVEAAEYFECPPSVVSNVKAAVKRPNALMLAATGHEWYEGYRSIK